MKQDGKFILFETNEEFRKWLNKTAFTRAIYRIQNHHTYLPDYKAFYSNPNHFAMVKGMESYHINSAGFSEIAQNLTSFPDGKIMLCRSFETAPAGIKGFNTGAICIEHVGNFDAEVMTPEHKKAILFMNAAMCAKFNIPVGTEQVVYHHWFDLVTGARLTDSVAGTRKTCPGVKFFSGNTEASAKVNFIPLVANEVSEVKFLNSLDKLVSRGVISSPDYWIKNCISGGTVLPQYAATLITKATGVSDIYKAIDKMVKDKIISSPDYWKNAFIKNELINGLYMKALITKLG